MGKGREASNFKGSKHRHGASANQHPREPTSKSVARAEGAGDWTFCTLSQPKSFSRSHTILVRVPRKRGPMFGNPGNQSHSA